MLFTRIKNCHYFLVTLFQVTILIQCKLARYVYKDRYAYKNQYVYKNRYAGPSTKDEYAYKPRIGSVCHPKFCVNSGIFLQSNLEPLIATKVTPITHVDQDVVRTGQEACGTRTESIQSQNRQRKDQNSFGHLPSCAIDLMKI